MYPFWYAQFHSDHLRKLREQSASVFRSECNSSEGAHDLGSSDAGLELLSLCFGALELLTEAAGLGGAFQSRGVGFVGAATPSSCVETAAGDAGWGPASSSDALSGPDLLRPATDGGRSAGVVRRMSGRRLRAPMAERTLPPVPPCSCLVLGIVAIRRLA